MTLDPRKQQEPAPRALRAGAIGVPGMVAMVVGATAPITALASNLSLSLAFGAEPATLFVIVGIVGVQFALLASLVVAVLVRGPAGPVIDATAPAALLGGRLGLSVVFVLLSFSGYEAAAAYCEEARDARRTVAVATYLALLLLGVVFLVATAAVVAAVPDVRATAQADPGSLVFGVFATYLGAWTGPVLGFVVAASFLGATVAFHSMATRYMFALGRAGLLPAALARTHPTRATPHVGVAVQVVIGALLVVPFAIVGADPFVGLFPAISGVTSLAVIVLMTACCASVVRAAALGLVTGSAWATRIAPVLAGAALLACGGLIVANYPDVTGTSSPWINVLPLILAMGAAYGALAQRRRAVLDLPVDRA
ncbi:amino acid permease-like protein [Pseudonocardia hierapolitana]|uniref:Amino acid permease-like protein n=1 Tax=Pseudonocardia hierapolitana TaxID=1128676 RepID=A0A561T3R8_9PSEU|nr:amino acid permease [Pseudonocardia hierapolitana]TWF81761.1 amino acid permease-like protein [Pseudonocardia hierapolitana]